MTVSLAIVFAVMLGAAAITWLLDLEESRRHPHQPAAAAPGALRLCELPSVLASRAPTQPLALPPPPATEGQQQEVVLLAAFTDSLAHAPLIVGLTETEAMQIGLLAALRDSGHFDEWYWQQPERKRAVSLRHAGLAANFLVGADDETYENFKHLYWDA